MIHGQSHRVHGQSHRVGAPQLVCGSSAKGFHFYTLIGSQILSECKLL